VGRQQRKAQEGGETEMQKKISKGRRSIEVIWKVLREMKVEVNGVGGAKGQLRLSQQDF
jgi:hypothetical protein